jgi:lysophospholipase-3
MAKWGYSRGHNIRAAPYDFRFAPHSSGEYFEKLRHLVEETYEMNDNTPVTILAHSMGGIYGQYFLHTHMVEQAWKDKYINAFIPVNCPWKGTVIISNLYTSGYNWGIAPIDRGVLKMQLTSWETGVLLLPQEDAWDYNDILVSTAKRNYTARDYDDYFRDVDNPIGRQLFENIRHKSYDMGHPGVDTYCVYSYGIDTPNQLVYDEGEFPDGHATMLMGPGDGTVNLMSLKFCKQWLSKHNSHHVADVRTYEGVPHIDLLFNPEFFKLLKEIVTNV